MSTHLRITMLALIISALCVVSSDAGQSAAAATSALKDPVTGMDFVQVPAGCYLAGTSDGNSDEKPPHKVCISGFYLGRYEVTQGEWHRVMGSNPAVFNKCGDNCPVDQVSWSDAQEFILKLNGLTGRNYRLPTEAEWEYACRGGDKGGKYCGGDDVTAVAWTAQNSAGRVYPVGQKKPNSLGIYDMSGNVWEWVQDWNYKYAPGRQTDPAGPATGSSRIRRGGSWQYDAAKARATWRSSGYQDDRAMDIGFRLALPAAPLKSGRWMENPD